MCIVSFDESQTYLFAFLCNALLRSLVKQGLQRRCSFDSFWERYQICYDIPCCVFIGLYGVHIRLTYYMPICGIDCHTWSIHANMNYESMLNAIYFFNHLKVYFCFILFCRLHPLAPFTRHMVQFLPTKNTKIKILVEQPPLRMFYLVHLQKKESELKFLCNVKFVMRSSFEIDGLRCFENHVIYSTFQYCGAVNSIQYWQTVYYLHSRLVVLINNVILLRMQMLFISIQLSAQYHTHFNSVEFPWQWDF